MHDICGFFFLFRLQVRNLADGIKARTLFSGIEIPMPDDQRLGEAGMQTFHQIPKCLDLLRRTGVNLTPQGVEAPFVANADAMPVVVHHMCPHFLQRPADLNLASPPYDEVVSNTLPSLLLVPVVDVLGRAPLLWSDRRAVDYYKGYRPHTQWNWFCGMPPCNWSFPVP